MNKFTKDEITLARQLHELGEKQEIEKGDWFIYEDPMCRSGWSEPTLNIYMHEPEYGYGKNVLLPSLHDCLEWLRGRRWVVELYWICEPEVVVNYLKSDKVLNRYRIEAPTPLEALLKAMVAIIKQ